MTSVTLSAAKGLSRQADRGKACPDPSLRSGRHGNEDFMPAKLFQPLIIGPREAKNRIIFGSHTTNFARHNLLSEQHADYYAARAAGGAGIIVLEEHIVHPSDIPYEYALAGYLSSTPAAIARVAERIHAHGTLAIAQLNHNG